MDYVEIRACIESARQKRSQALAELIGKTWAGLKTMALEIWAHYLYPWPPVKRRGGERLHSGWPA